MVNSDESSSKLQNALKAQSQNSDQDKTRTSKHHNPPPQVQTLSKDQESESRELLSGNGNKERSNIEKSILKGENAREIKRTPNVHIQTDSSELDETKKFPKEEDTRHVETLLNIEDEPNNNAETSRSHGQDLEEAMNGEAYVRHLELASEKNGNLEIRKSETIIQTGKIQKGKRPPIPPPPPKGKVKWGGELNEESKLTNSNPITVAENLSPENEYSKLLTQLNGDDKASSTILKQDGETQVIGQIFGSSEAKPPLQKNKDTMSLPPKPPLPPLKFPSKLVSETPNLPNSKNLNLTCKSEDPFLIGKISPIHPPSPPLKASQKAQSHGRESMETIPSKVMSSDSSPKTNSKNPKGPPPPPKLPLKTLANKLPKAESTEGIFQNRPHMKAENVGPHNHFGSVKVERPSQIGNGEDTIAGENQCSKGIAQSLTIPKYSDFPIVLHGWGPRTNSIEFLKFCTDSFPAPLLIYICLLYKYKLLYKLGHLYFQADFKVHDFIVYWEFHFSSSKLVQLHIQYNGVKLETPCRIFELILTMIDQMHNTFKNGIKCLNVIP